MDSDLIIRNFRESLCHIASKPGLYVQPVNYFTLAALLDGYMMGIESLAKFDIHVGFTQWLNRSKGTNTGIAWQFAILHHIAKDNEEYGITLLAPLLIEYLDDPSVRFGPARN